MWPTKGDMGGKVTYNNGPNTILICLDQQAEQMVVNYTRHECALGPASFRSRPNSGKEGLRQRWLPKNPNAKQARS